MTTPMLSVEGVSHSYGTRRALDNVTFAVAPATFSVMLGLNGAGKSTLFALITRLYGTQHGRIRILDFDVAQVSGEALRILGVVFQSRTLDLDLTIMQNLMYHAALHGLRRREAEIRAEELLTRIALSDRVDDKVRNLSGGQMRRVEIAPGVAAPPSPSGPRRTNRWPRRHLACRYPAACAAPSCRGRDRCLVGNASDRRGRSTRSYCRAAPGTALGSRPRVARRSTNAERQASATPFIQLTRSEDLIGGAG